MLTPLYTIVNKHTGRFPCVAGDYYSESGAPRSASMMLSVADARKEIKTVEKKALEYQEDLTQSVKDWNLMLKKSTNLEDIAYNKRNARKHGKLLVTHKQREFVIVKVSYETIK